MEASLIFRTFAPLIKILIYRNMDDSNLRRYSYSIN